jgi:hypothetical protein
MGYVWRPGGAGGACRSDSWRGRYIALMVGFDVQSASMRGRNDAQAHALEIGWVGWLSEWAQARLQWLGLIL